jgi:hypothetical protein
MCLLFVVRHPLVDHRFKPVYLVSGDTELEARHSDLSRENHMAKSVCKQHILTLAGNNTHS